MKPTDNRQDEEEQRRLYSQLPSLRSLQLGVQQRGFSQQTSGFNNNIQHTPPATNAESTWGPFTPITNDTATISVSSYQANNMRYCTVRIVGGKYDSIGQCWLDEVYYKFLAHQ
jgi:hypothetical protein